MQLLASGTADDWRRAKDQHEQLATVLFNMVDVDSSGSVDKQELFVALKHGKVSPRHLGRLTLNWRLHMPPMYCTVVSPCPQR